MSDDRTVKPLHTGSVGGHPLRFFRSPIDDGRPDFPWHAVDDLQRCLLLDRAERKHLLARLQFHETRGMPMLRTAATAGGIITIAPHYMAQATITALTRTGEASPDDFEEYTSASCDAMEELAVDIGDPRCLSDAWLQAARHRWDHLALERGMS